MLPKLFTFGDFYLPTYGLLVTLGFIAGLWLSGKLAERRGLSSNAITDLAVSVALAGLLGAKLLMLIYDFDYYRRNPGEIFSMATLQAGGVFYGGLIAALIVAVWFLRKRKLPFLPVADVFAPGIALGHAIGRIGCFAAGCCWGAQCDLPWAVTFRNPEAHKLVGVPLNIPLHPSQIYEAAAETAIFIWLYSRVKRPHRPGHIIGQYLILYPLARFLVEFVRFHEQPNPFGWWFSLGQWITVSLLVVGVWLLVRKETIVPAKAG